jgi:phage terminase small subunit
MLTPKQENFCLEYLKTGNASEAYRRAYNTKKMKPETINRMGKAMIDDPKIAARIADLRKPVTEAAQIDLTRTVKEIVRLAVFDPRKLLNEDGTPKPLSELDDDTAAAVSGIKVRHVRGDDGETAAVIEYKISDKNSALDKLMKHLGGYEKDNSQKADAVAAMIAEIGRGASTGAPAFPIAPDDGAD